jgi:hypothetical protein
LGQLRFVSLLNPYKRLWNTHVEKYGAFYDAWPVLLQLSWESFRSNLAQLCLHLILCCRLHCLHRSHDLANLRRSLSVVSSF